MQSDVGKANVHGMININFHTTVCHAFGVLLPSWQIAMCFRDHTRISSTLNCAPKESDLSGPPYATSHSHQKTHIPAIRAAGRCFLVQLIPVHRGVNPKYVKLCESKTKSLVCHAETTWQVFAHRYHHIFHVTSRCMMKQDRRNQCECSE